MRTLDLAPLIAVTLATLASGAPDEGIDFARDIRPILEARCHGCHGPERQKGRLRLDTRAAAFAGDPDGWVIRPGDPDGSALIARVSLPAADPDRMPADGEPLGAEQITLLRRWIEEGATWPEPAPPTAPGPFMVDFETQVRPILEARCHDCHGPERRKGKLRLDAREALFAGEPDDWVIRPGDASGSVLIARISLPDDDPDVMPAKGEPLDESEIALLRAWIEEGAYWPPDGPAAGDPTPLDIEIVLEPLSDAQRRDEARAIESIREIGGLALPIAERSDAKVVNLSLLRDALDDAALERLAGLEPSLVWLDLARTGITDEGAAGLARFAALRRLHLEQTAVGDAALRELARLPRLEYLNLYGTRVTDAGLVHLRDAERLRRLYVWRTGVSDAGVAALREARPELAVVWRVEGPPPAEREEAEK